MSHMRDQEPASVKVIVCGAINVGTVFLGSTSEEVVACEVCGVGEPTVYSL